MRPRIDGAVVVVYTGFRRCPEKMSSLKGPKFKKKKKKKVQMAGSEPLFQDADTHITKLAIEAWM